MLKVTDRMMDWYGGLEGADLGGPKRQGPTMPRVTSHTHRMTNISLGDGDYIQGIRKIPFMEPSPDLPDLTPPPAHKPLRYTPGLNCDAKLESLRPIRSIHHPALSGLDLAPTKEPVDPASRPYYVNPANPMDYASSYPQDELSRIKMRNRQFQGGSNSLDMGSGGGYVLITPSGTQVPLTVSSGGTSCAREAALAQSHNALPPVQGYMDFEPLEELKHIRSASPPRVMSLSSLPRPRTLIPSSATASNDSDSLAGLSQRRLQKCLGVPEHIAIRSVILSTPEKKCGHPGTTPPPTPAQVPCNSNEEDEPVTPTSQEDEPATPLNTPMEEEI